MAANSCPPPLPVLDLQSGAKGFQLSNPPVLECMTLMASLKVFQQTSMGELTRKSRVLTGYLELLLEEGLEKAAAEAAGKAGGEKRGGGTEECAKKDGSGAGF